MVKTRKKILLYAGLGMLALAYSVKWLDAPVYYFWILFGLAITFKVLFLIAALRSKHFRAGLWLYMILAGVALIMVSFIFKHFFSIPMIQNLLIYCAITLKLCGIMLMFWENRETGTANRKKK
ncbi:MAG: hypothetical protein LBE79_01990 [Tannerella sp.]|jgi:hypothetical protein|nr:hypothetical protein [Tannerella sp.]